MEATSELIDFGKQVAAVAIVVAVALSVLIREYRQRGGLSERDRRLLEKVNCDSVEIVIQLREELEKQREFSSKLAQRVSRIEGRLNGSPAGE